MIPGMMMDKKRTASLIIANSKPEEVSDIETDSNSGLDAAVEDMWNAVKNDDKAAYREALKSFIEMCDMSEDASEDAAEAEAPSELE